MRTGMGTPRSQRSPYFIVSSFRPIRGLHNGERIGTGVAPSGSEDT